MSENRYSLRATPKKVEHAGFVETPRTRGERAPRTRKSLARKSIFTEEDLETDDSSVTENAVKATGRNVNTMLEDVTNTERKAARSTAAEKMNGASNGSVNGKDNTRTNGLKIGETTGLLSRESASPAGSQAVGKDPKVDYSGEMDFGGSIGTSAMMIGFPLLMWYMWIGATYYDGKFPTPEAGQSFVDFSKHMGSLVYEGAFPSIYAWKIYWTFFIFEAACYCLLPGVWTYGKPLAHLGGKQLKYYCSGIWSFYTTIVVLGVMHFTGVFKLYTLIDEFGPIMSVAIISGYLVSIVAYFSALARGAEHRMTGYPIYDFFMGAELNPRMFGILDFKMFFEVRIPWFILFGLSCGAAARQYEQYDYVSGEVGFIVMAHFLYANACAKGEECITTTWDMYYEKWGFMLIFWNLAGVPLSYCHCTIYLANHPPSEYQWNKPFLIFLYASYLFVYWVWDTANSQKNRFRAMERGTFTPRRTFPQLPWGTLVNPRVIKTQTGDSLLADGWYGYGRKLHYTCDAYFAICWGLITGFKSPFPWFYPVFFVLMVSHRAYRDIQKCQAKYGDAWTEYTNLVPYLFIPYVF